MKRICLFCAILCLIPLAIEAQPVQSSPSQLVFMGSGWTDDSFSAGMNGGLKFGALIPLDKGRGLWLRPTYSRWNLQRVEAEVGNGEDDSHSFGVTAIMDYYVGKKWSIYLTLIGAETYTDGPLQGTDLFTGLGTYRRLWTAGDNDDLIPAHLDFFGEVIFADGSGQFSGNYLQLNIGLKFGRPVQR